MALQWAETLTSLQENLVCFPKSFSYYKLDQEVTSKNPAVSLSSHVSQYSVRNVQFPSKD